MVTATFTTQNTVGKKMNNKKKILTMSDHPLSPSGVGIQTKYFIEALLDTGRYSFVSLAGAMQHADYTPQKTEKYGDDWVIYPVDGYGNPEIVRSLMRTYKPDIVWFMTDPRFYGWLWEMEDEIRCHAPMIYYHVWDNKPYPTFNKKYYDSNDLVVTISKVTDDIVRNVSPDVNTTHLPHAVDEEVYKPLTQEEIATLKDNLNVDPDKFIFFWNNRNARRKQSGSLIFWFKEFLDKVGHDKATLIMHTSTTDPAGQDLKAIAAHLDMLEGQVQFSEEKVAPEQMSVMYNIADCTINVADAEGFGLGTLESLYCETPIIVTMTGGLQEQVTDGENWFGIGLEPASKSIIGSQPIPWIYEDRVDGNQVVEAMQEMYNKTKEERKALGQAGRQHALKNYNFEGMKSRWVEIIDKMCEENGSWETRKNYDRWELTEVS